MRAYVVNSAHQRERLAAVSAEFARLDLSFQRIEALDPASTAPRELEGYFRPGPLGVVSHEDRCQLFSHLRAWRVFLESGEPAGAVFEDDAALLDGAAPFLTTNGWLPKGASIVQLEEGKAGRPVLVRRAQLLALDRTIAPLLSSRPSLRAYAISRAMAASWFSGSRQYRMPLPEYLFDPAVSFECRASSRWVLVSGIACANRKVLDAPQRTAFSSSVWRCAPYRMAQAARELALRATGRAVPAWSLL